MRTARHILLAVALLIPGLSAEDPNPIGGSVTLHGTVNIVLGNGNGAVVATDSRLSGLDGRPVGSGQKLFRLDDHTVCSIAGFFSDPGPDFGANQRLASTTVPGIINAYLRRRKQDTPIEITARDVAGAIIFSLELIGNLDLAANIPYPGDIQITVVGYDSSGIRVIYFRLQPAQVSTQVRYVIAESSSRSVGATLFRHLAGIEDTGRALLNLTPENARRFIPSDPVVQHYADEMYSNQGQTLTLRDLEQLSGDIEFMTSKAYPNLVGGPLQTATLSGGKISRWESTFPLQDVFPGALQTWFFTRNTFDGFFPRIIATPTLGVMVDGNSFTRVREFPIDNLIITNNTFVSTTFSYSGSMALMDSSNRIGPDCALLVAPTVTDDNPVLKQIKASFPDLRIIRRGGSEAAN